MMQLFVTNSRCRLPIVLVFIATCVRLASLQPRRDADEDCLGDPSHPVYQSYEQPLMDTRDYLQLLPAGSDGVGGVWKVLNEDGDRHTWIRTGATCASELHVCGGSEAGTQENWLITNHISRQASATLVYNDVHVRFESTHISSNPCSLDTPSCVDKLSVYMWESSVHNTTSSYSTNNYHFIGNVGTNEITIPFSDSSQYTGFYLGIRDNGTCMNVQRILVYAITCEATTLGLVQVNETNPNSNSFLQGECVANSLPVNESGPLMECTDSGEWSVIIGCECSPHYFVDNSAQLCLQLPSAPQNMNVSSVTDTSATISWEPPDITGGPTLYYRVSYTAPPPLVPVITIQQNTTELSVTGLTPYLPYTFSVSAENSVSFQDANITARTATVTAKTLEGVAAQVTEIRIHDEADDVIISWQQPYPPHGVILYYNIKIIEPEREHLFRSYTGTSISREKWTDEWKIASDHVKIQVQAETYVGPGEFSAETDVTMTTSETSSNSFNVSTEVLAGIVTTIVILLALIVIILVMIRCIWRRKASSNPTLFKIEEYASVKLSPTDSMYSEVSPPIPRSPRPSTLEQLAANGSSSKAIGVPTPMYFELVNPQKSSLIKNRSNRNVKPLSSDPPAPYETWPLPTDSDGTLQSAHTVAT